MPELPPQRNLRPLLWVLLLTLLVICGLLVRFFLVAPGPPAPGAPARQLRTVTLYFAAKDGSALVAEGRQIPDCPVEDACLQAVVQGLLDGPSGDLTPVFPPQAALRGLTVAGSELQIDFTRALIDSHPGGSWGELLTVYALADTVAVNFPHLRQVRILVDGVAVETLKGHVDLRQPISPDFTMILKSSAGVPTAPSAGRPQ